MNTIRSHYTQHLFFIGHCKIVPRTTSLELFTVNWKVFLFVDEGFLFNKRTINITYYAFAASFMQVSECDYGSVLFQNKRILRGCSKQYLVHLMSNIWEMYLMPKEILLREGVNFLY